MIGCVHCCATGNVTRAAKQLRREEEEEDDDDG